MGVNTNYLGHVEIVPPLNKVEYDYLTAFSRSRRTMRQGGPYAVMPEDPDTGTTPADVDRYNSICAGQPGYWCQWVPCPHGCCLGWNGFEKFYAGPAWLKYLINHFLRQGALAASSGEAQFADFTFNHRMNGVVVGEQQDLRELFILWVNDDEVTQQTLRRGDPDYGQPGYIGLEDRPWLAAGAVSRGETRIADSSTPPGTTVDSRERRTGRTEMARPIGQFDRRGCAG